MNPKAAILTRAALLLALTLLFQSLRLMIPMPPFLSTILIGSLMNTCLLVATGAVGFRFTLMIVMVAPVVAYFQQVLPLPMFIVPVAVGNSIYIGLFLIGHKWRFWLRIGVIALAKAIFMYGSFTWLLTFIAIPSKVAAGLLFIMSWPQLVTGIIGGIISASIIKRLKLL
jgi:hypothetical protein